MRADRATLAAALVDMGPPAWEPQAALTRLHRVPNRVLAEVHFINFELVAQAVSDGLPDELVEGGLRGLTEEALNPAALCALANAFLARTRAIVAEERLGPIEARVAELQTELGRLDAEWTAYSQAHAQLLVRHQETLRWLVDTLQELQAAASWGLRRRTRTSIESMLGALRKELA